MTQTERYNYWLELFHDAVSKRQDVDIQIARREKLYRGEQPDGNTAFQSSRRRPSPHKDEEAITRCHHNMCFELVETQINSSTPMPKITPMVPTKERLAHKLESFLRMEMDRLQSERINDRVERGVLKQGTHFYHVYWDDNVRYGNVHGAIGIKDYSIADVWLQPGVTNFEELEYLFTYDRVTKNYVHKITGASFDRIPECPDYKGLCELITTWYYNKDGYVCRFAWIKDTDFIVFDDRDFESRRVVVCADCGYQTQDEVCPICGSEKKSYRMQRYEILQEDIVKNSSDTPDAPPLIVAEKNSELKYYAVNQLPFVIRVNVSDDQSIYGISDIDIMENNQIALNNVTSKIEQNILKAGSLVTIPMGMNFRMSNETLKVVRLKDPKWADAVQVKNLQATIQQDDIFADRMYQYGRSALGITDSYQGKRDPTAESGKAKEIAAAQAAGRMESKRKMKDAAYADLYKLMFKFFLAYCDDPEDFVISDTDGSIVGDTISRYEFLDGPVGKQYYDDAMLFSVDSASVLYTSRESMWQEATNNFLSGTMGNPADPEVQLLFWNIMDELNYPLAKQCLANISQRLNAVMQALAQQQTQTANGNAQTAPMAPEEREMSNNSEAQAAIAAGMQQLLGGMK